MPDRDTQPERDRSPFDVVRARADRVLGPPTGRPLNDPPIEPLDRSYLLRRGREFPFPDLLGDPTLIRLRRERRVSASFRAIRPLTRDGRL